jgi:hypothetical protein
MKKWFQILRIQKRKIDICNEIDTFKNILKMKDCLFQKESFKWKEEKSEFVFIKILCKMPKNPLKQAKVAKKEDFF